LELIDVIKELPKLSIRLNIVGLGLCQTISAGGQKNCHRNDRGRKYLLSTQ